MACLVYSTDAFFQKQCLGVEALPSILVKDQAQLFAFVLEKHPRFVWLHVKQKTEEVYSLCEELLTLSPQTHIVVFRNNPDVLEGVALLKRGIKGYAHALSNPHILLQIHQTLQQGHVWVYPELMQFMIASMQAPLSAPCEGFLKLSSKEKEIALLVSQGLSNANIARILNVAEITVKKHISTLFEKLNVKDRIALALRVKQL